MSSRQPVALSSRPPDSAAPGRRGRRPSGSDTRGEIVAAARGEFSAQGYDATSLRAVARRAGVDSALVHHYFAGKPALFAEVMELPLDPVVLVAAIVAAPRDEVGATLVRSFFTVWDDAEGRERFQGVIRSALTHEAAARMIREFLTEGWGFARGVRGARASGEQVALDRRANESNEILDRGVNDRLESEDVAHHRETYHLAAHQAATQIRLRVPVDRVCEVDGADHR